MTLYKNLVERQRLPKAGLEVLSMLESAGYEAYLVGGLVRDLLLGRDAHDVDVTTNAGWEDVVEVAKAHGYSSYDLGGVEYGTIVLDVDHELVEVTTYRVDGEYSDSRRPLSVKKAKSLVDDLSRRDFTVNALACNANGDVVDEFEGVYDLVTRRLRTVGDPRGRFSEDSLRLLRLVRFQSELGFSVDDAANTALHEMVDDLDNVSKERVQKELRKLLCGEYVERVLLEHSDVITKLFPELYETVGFDQKSPWHHLNVYDHTAKVVSKCVKYDDVRFAALLHDCGKPESFEVGDDGVGHFPDHAKFSAAKTRDALTRLRLPAFEVNTVAWLVENHDRELHPSKASVKRLLNKAGGDYFKVRALLSLRRADVKAQRKDVETRLEKVDKFEELLDEVMTSDEAFSLKHLEVNGHDMMDLGLRSHDIKYALNMLLDEVVDEKLENSHDVLVARVEEEISRRGLPMTCSE